MTKTSTILGVAAAVWLGGGLSFHQAAAQASGDAAPAGRAQQTRSSWAGPGFEAADARLSNSYTDAARGLEYVYMQQQYQGIPVYNRIATLAFRQGRLVHHAGTFVDKRKLAQLPSAPAVTAGAAVATALQPLSARAAGRPAALRPTSSPSGPEARQTFAAPGLARRDVVASLVWAEDARGALHLCWNVNVDVEGQPDWLNIRVDAATGTIVAQDNWTVHERAATRFAPMWTLLPPALRPAGATGNKTAARPQAPAAAQLLQTASITSASYRVLAFPLESPRHGSFSIETDPWLKAGAGNSATTHGWHYDGATDYATTQGNNVWAYDDVDNNDAPGNFGTSPSATPLAFSSTPDFGSAPGITSNQQAALANLFYWNNIIHDVTYQYGFTEAAGNFQQDNLNRGGAGNDYVHAQAQDGGGINNANFRTPPDGTGSRMQMYLWNPATPPLQVTAPTAIAGLYPNRESTFSTANKLANVGPVSGQVVLYTDSGNPSSNQACAAHAGPSLVGKVALISRGTCGFTVKVKNAQNAGAIAAIVIQNNSGPATVMGGTDNSITIPAVMISQADGATLQARLADGVEITLGRPGQQLDGDFDNGVIVHEYGHGISNRLTGGPANTSCLGNAEQAGEGWSDFFGLMLTTNWQQAQMTDGPTARGIGTYANGQLPQELGLRRYPYSTSMSVNPLTYANMLSTTGVHDNGEIWCATVWDMTWNIIQQEGAIEPNLYNSASTGGNAVAMQLVMQGLKLQPCQPGFLDARDAILAADELLYGGRHRCAIWQAFARRGMGVDARQGSSQSAGDQTPGYALPSGVTLQPAQVVMSGNTFDIALTATCGCGTPPTDYSVSNALPTGLEYVSSTGGTLNGNTVTFANVAFTQELQSRTLRIQARTAAGAGCEVSRPIDDNRDDRTTGGLTSQSVSGGAAWTISTAYAASGTRSWWAPALDTPSEALLTSASFTPGSLTTLSFTHYYNYEPSYDGGLVELSTNGGTTWTDASPYFVQNGYSTTFDASTAAPGRACFSGRSANAGFVTSVLNLSSFSGTPLQVRFRSLTDSGSPSGYEGWFIDDIQVLSGCGGTQQIQATNGSGTSSGQKPVFTFLTPASTPMPVTLLQFDARWQPTGALLTWATASEQNAARFELERSLDLTTWTAVGQLPAAGTSTSRRDYQLLDAAALAQPADMLYYRLRQLDTDGTAHLSAVRTLARSGAAVQLQARPNPFGATGLQLRLSLPAAQAQLELSLHDATGRRLLHRTLAAPAGTSPVAWPEAAALPAGLYIVRLHIPGQRPTALRVVRE